MARRNLLILIPPLAFLVFASVAYVGLHRDNPDELPSALVGQPAPGFARVTPLEGPPPTEADLTAPGVKLVNFWASWCGPCRAEHPYLSGLAAEGVPVFGVNYKDDPEDALKFLAQYGNPFDAVGVDETGRNAIDWGVYGVPETFVVDPTGRIVLKHVGPLDDRALHDELGPAIEAALAD